MVGKDFFFFNCHIRPSQEKEPKLWVRGHLALGQGLSRRSQLCNPRCWRCRNLALETGSSCSVSADLLHRAGCGCQLLSGHHSVRTPGRCGGPGGLAQGQWDSPEDTLHLARNLRPALYGNGGVGGMRRERWGPCQDS